MQIPSLALLKTSVLKQANKAIYCSFHAGPVSSSFLGLTLRAQWTFQAWVTVTVSKGREQCFQRSRDDWKSMEWLHFLLENNISCFYPCYAAQLNLPHGPKPSRHSMSLLVLWQWLSKPVPLGLKWETSYAENTWVSPDWAKVGSVIKVCNGLISSRKWPQGSG